MQTKKLLDFIAGPESKGNYNAYFGGVNSTKDLSGMSVQEILSWMKARTDKGSPSSATGRYQFMRKTLLGLVTQMGLSVDQKFTPDLQDRMAVQLLKTRGLDRYLAGSMTDEDFALQVSKEWASMPNPKTGRSYYAGDGLNASLVTVEDFLKAIKSLKEAPPVQTATPVAPVPSKTTPESPEPARRGFWASVLSLLTKKST